MKKRLVYVALMAAAWLLGIMASWTAFGRQIDSFAYDFVFRLHQPKPWPAQSMILALDQATLKSLGGVRGMRQALAMGLEKVAAAHPKAVAVDVILAEPADEAGDAALEAAFRKTPNLVLPCDLLPDEKGWDDPLPRFRKLAVAVGQVHAGLDSLDAISRELPLELAAGKDRRWALALEAFRASDGSQILESPDDLDVGGTIIPARLTSAGRLLRIRYRPLDSPISRISVKQLMDKPGLAAQFTGKVVFAGLTDQTAVRDRWMTPYSNGSIMPGVEIHASAFETIAEKMFLVSAPEWSVLLFAMALTAGAGLTFAYLSGWAANVAAASLVIAAHLVPYAAFTERIVFPYLPGTLAVWLAIVAAASWRHFVVRGQLGKSESERLRYQHAMHFVTHEMRTPLTAIQGSSELIGRYAMTDEKRKQMAALIVTESKRLGSMIETFLSVERLSAGEIQLKEESFTAAEVMQTCLSRALPLAERKQIAIDSAELPNERIRGDRELIEYAFFNILTNAVKYSPAGTRIELSGRRVKDRVSVSVRDQGIGMNQREMRRVFEKFYRTTRAQQSGEAGSGIGLSIVEQIVEQHGGSILVESEPGKGSCFTLLLPVER